MMQDVSEAAQISVKFNQEKKRELCDDSYKQPVNGVEVPVSVITQHGDSLFTLNIHFCEYIFSYMFLVSL
jgi:hypothetical protein